jgi:hypothetical protein
LKALNLSRILREDWTKTGKTWDLPQIRFSASETIEFAKIMGILVVVNYIRIMAKKLGLGWHHE